MKHKYFYHIFAFILIISISLAFYRTIKGVDKINHTRTFELNYNVSLKGLPKNSKQLEIWIPVPQSDSYQNIENLQVKSDYTYSIYNESEYENKVLYLNLQDNISESLDISFVCNVTRRAVVKNTYYSSKNDIERFLLPDSLVPIEGIISKEAFKVVSGKRNDSEKAKVIYDHLVQTMVYDKSGTGWGRGDAIYACTARQGNCTDFHSLFIGMARANKIPSRFVIGFPLPENSPEGKINDYHCWAEYYIQDKGWIPIDASEAYKHPEKKEFYFGNLDADRVQFTIGRDIKLLSQKSSIRLNYFIYPYVLIDGKPYHMVDTLISFKNKIKN